MTTDNKGAAKAALGLGMAAGAIVGAATALLLAPQSGKKTRKDIKHKAEEKWHQSKHKAEDAKDAAQEKAGDVADSAKENASKVKQAAKEAKDAAQEEFE